MALFESQGGAGKGIQGRKDARVRGRRFSFKLKAVVVDPI